MTSPNDIKGQLSAVIAQELLLCLMRSTIRQQAALHAPQVLYCHVPYFVNPHERLFRFRYGDPNGL